MVSGSGNNRRPLNGRWLQELAKLGHGEASVAHDPAHRVSIHRIVAGNRKQADTVGHDDVLTLSGDSKARLLQGLDRILVIDTGDLRHTLRDFDFAYHGPFQQVLPGSEVLPDGVLNILESFQLGGTLRPATREARA